MTTPTTGGAVAWWDEATSQWKLVPGGLKGDRGPQGERGLQGPQGAPGSDGHDGAAFVPSRSALEELLYDKAYSWEKVPGSDVMATAIGVLPKIGTDTGYDYYAGLVTVEAGVLPLATQAGEAWLLRPAGTALTTAALDASSGPGSEQAYAAGVWLAYYSCPSTSQPPYAFPEGWTPGNTTGSGPVLPLIGRSSDNSYGYWAGLVEVAVDAPNHEDTWNLYAPDAPLTFDFLDNASDLSGPFAPGVYLAMTSPAPTALPTGWTFRPYGLGPVTSTDENAGGLIGDVAYVVSGYVTDDSGPLRILRTVFGSSLREITADGTYFFNVGEIVSFGGGPAVIITVAGSGVYGNGGTTFEADGTLSWDSNPTVLGTSDYWPFIEHFDLAAKKWLPRVPMPEITINAEPWTARDYPEYSVYVTHNGRLWERNHAFSHPTPTDVPEAGSNFWHDVTGTPKPYAAEGGIAGVIDGKLYFGGGDGEGYVSGQEFFVYDPADDSITRLADMDADYPDYTPYGVVGGKLWYANSTTAWAYDPVSDSWASHETDARLSQYAGDQVQGFEINGKLWFVYDGAASVFDPVALTVTAKALRAGGPALNEGAVFLVDGKLRLYGGEVGVPAAAEYDPVLDTWTDLEDIAVPLVQKYLSGAETFNVTYNGVPYALTGVENAVAGVRGLTGVGYDRPRSARMQDRMDDSLGTLVLIAADHSGWNEETIALPLQNGATVTVTMHAVTNAGYNDCVYHFRVAGRPDLVADVIINRFVPVAGGYVINTILAGYGLPLDGSQRLPDTVTFPADGPYSFNVSLQNVRRRA